MRFLCQILSARTVNTGTIVILIVFIAALALSFTPAATARGQAERNVGIRFAALAWMIGIMLTAALIFLPMKSQVLMLGPIFLTAAGIGKVWQIARARARRDAQKRVDLERMKRLN